MVAIEERNVNVTKSVMMQYCFKDEGKQETTKKEENTKTASLHLQRQKKELFESQPPHVWSCCCCEGALWQTVLHDP